MTSPGRGPSWLGARLRDPGAWTLCACLAVVLTLVAPAIVYCPGHGEACRLGLTHLGSTADQRYFAAVWEAARVSLQDFHQLPSWNPYHCGGIVLYQDPQAPFPGPLFLLTFFWLPTAVAIKVWVLLHLLVGALGARSLVRDRGGNPAEQVLGAALVAACGFMAEHIGGGHLAFTPFLFLPFILWAFRRALVDARYAVGVAALFALAAVEGGTYAVPLMAVAVAIECLVRLGSAADRRALCRVVPITLGLFALLAGVRLVPVLCYLREHPRAVPLDDAVTLGEVFRFWTTRSHTRAVAGHPYVWPEYDDYVGLVPVALMLAGVGVALLAPGPGGDRQARRERRIDLAVFAALVWCALGNIEGPSPFGLLHRLPIYGSLRVPSRFLGPATVGLALLAVGALTAGRAALARLGLGSRARRAAAILEVVLVLGVALDVTLTNQRVIQQGLDPLLSRAAAGVTFFQNTAANYSQFPSFPVRGIGTRSCYVPLEWKPAPGIVDGPVEQARVEPPDLGRVTATSWSPNRLELDARLAGPATVVVNQNYESGWRLEGAADGVVGAYVVPERQFWDVRARPSDLPRAGAIGLLAVRLPAGLHHIVLRHRPPGLGWGILATLVGLLGSGLILTGAKGRTKPAHS